MVGVFKILLYTFVVCFITRCISCDSDFDNFLNGRKKSFCTTILLIVCLNALFILCILSDSLCDAVDNLVARAIQYVIVQHMLIITPESLYT